MKKILLVFLVLSPVIIFSQSSTIYSFNADTGSIKLVEVDIVGGTQNIIAYYDTTEIYDYETEAITFDHANKHLVLVAWQGSVCKILSIDVTNGNIVYNYQPSFEPYELEYGNGKAYTINWYGQQPQLVEFDLVAGSETIIGILDTTKISDYNPETSTFDHQNNRFVVGGWYNSSPRLFSIDVTNANIVYDYQMSFEPNEIEFGIGKAYCINWMTDFEIVEIDLSTGSETVSTTVDTSLISDYNPEVSSFDYQNNKLIVAGWYNSVEKFYSIDVTNGSLLEYTSGFIINVAENNSDFSSSIEENNNSSLFVYPNPAANEINISIEGYNRIEIINYSGQIVLNSESSILDVSDFTPGVYIYKIFLNDKTLAGKFIKK